MALTVINDNPACAAGVAALLAFHGATILAFVAG